MNTVNDLVAAFLEGVQARGVDDKTITSYITSFNRIQTFMIANDSESAHSGIPTTRGAGGCQPLILATQKDVSNFKKWLVAHYKNATVCLTLRHVNALFTWAVKAGHMVDNPLTFVERPAKAPAVIKWLSESEQNAVIREARRVKSSIGSIPTGSQTAAQLRDYAIVITFLRVGLRVEELCDAKVADVKITPHKGSIYIKGKGDKDRTVPLNKEVRGVLAHYLESRKDNPSPYLFPSQRSPQSTTRAIQHMVESYRDTLQLPHLTCHTLRHTFGHDLAQAHVSLDIIAKLMGHFKKDGSPNIAMTMIYTTPGMADLEKAVEEIAWT
jgi:site-specific recombinase XerD